MIVLGIIVWVLCAGIMCGFMMHDEPGEREDIVGAYMFACLLGWPILAFASLIYLAKKLAMKQLSKIGMFFAGLIDKLFERKEEQDG